MGLHIIRQVGQICRPDVFGQGAGPGLGQDGPLAFCGADNRIFDVLLQIFQNAVHDLPVAGGALSAALEDLQRGLGSLQHVQVGHHVLAAELAGIVRVRLPGSGDDRLALQRNRADSGDPFYHRQGGLRIEEGVVGIRRGCNQGFLRIRQVLICRPGGYNGILAPGADFFPNRFHQIVKRLYCGHVVRRYAPAQGLHRLVETGDLRCLQIKLAADTQCLVSRFCSFNF